MTQDVFTTKNLGRYIEFPGTGSALNQCMDLMRYAIRDVWGIDPYVIPRAKDAKSAFDACKTNTKIKKIYNTPTGVPKKGDLVFFKYYPFLYGGAGHVGLVESATMSTIIIYEQNYPTYKPCRFGKHSYRGCKGWVRKV